MDNLDSTIVTLYADRIMQIRDATESLRLFKTFVMLSAARRRTSWTRLNPRRSACFQKICDGIARHATQALPDQEWTRHVALPADTHPGFVIDLNYDRGR